MRGQRTDADSENQKKNLVILESDSEEPEELRISRNLFDNNTLTSIRTRETHFTLYTCISHVELFLFAL